MPIFNSPFDTTAKDGSSPIAIEREIVKDWGESVQSLLGGSVYEIRPSRGYDTHIPVFVHPLPIQLSNQNSIGLGTSGVVVVVDARQYLKPPAIPGGPYITTNYVEQTIQHTRASMQYIWSAKDRLVLRDAAPMVTNFYASWLSDNIAKRFALGAREQYRLHILAGIFYQCLFTDEVEFTDREMDRVAVHVAKQCRAKVDDVHDIIKTIGKPMSNVFDFCELAPEIAETHRLKELNVGLLFSIVGGTWFSTNAKELTAVALEHPPTWMALCYCATSDRGFRNTVIAKIIERNGSATSRNYVLSVKYLTDNFLDVIQ